jgi:uncharacterized protein (DUF2147 family)
MFERLRFFARASSAALLGIAIAGVPAQAAGPAAVTGMWATEDGHGVIAIEACGDALCGRIVGIVRKPGEPMPTDVHGASECGMTIISEERSTGDGSWLGEIVDPRSGTTYGARLRVDEVGNLRLRAFLGLPIFGETRIWHRFTGHLGAACELA